MGELEAVRGLTKFLFGVIALAAVAYLLAWNGIQAGIMVLCLAFGLYMYIMRLDGLRLPLEASCSKNVYRLVACVLMVCLYISTYNASVFLKIKDPASSVRGVGVKDLAEAYERKPNAYDVVLTDGFVQILWAGYYTEPKQKDPGPEPPPRESFSAAPIYKDAASASGVPSAWAVSNQELPPCSGALFTPNCGQFQATYCPGGGVCGFKSQDAQLDPKYSVLSSGAYYGGDSGHTTAAKRAAQKMGIEFPEGLPTLEMINPLIALKSSEEWYALFYPFLFATLACCAQAEMETIMAYGKGDELDESTPLNAA